MNDYLCMYIVMCDYLCLYIFTVCLKSAKRLYILIIQLKRKILYLFAWYFFRVKK